jgi:hypothetical protein
MDWGTIVWIVMSFGMKNEPPTYQSIVNQTSKKYLEHFMKFFFFDDFTIFNDMDTHMSKLMLCCNQNWGSKILLTIMLNDLMPTIKLQRF